MKPRLLNLLTALSVLQCVAVLALWVRVYVVSEGIVSAKRRRHSARP
jgi:hypothetical protein